MCQAKRIAQVAELGEEVVQLARAQVHYASRLEPVVARLEVLADKCTFGDFTVFGNVHSAWIACQEALRLQQGGTAPYEVVAALLTVAAWRLEEALRGAQRSRWTSGAGVAA